MENQMIFERYELKYRITRAQQQELLACMQGYMAPDCYGRSTLRSIYYDTDSFRLIRDSLDKPVYKEKLRVRSYGRVAGDGTVFVELKKKYRDVVYKRRIELPERTAMQWLAGRAECPEQSQIAREIEYFRSFYPTLRPAVLITCSREAFAGVRDEGFRLTFDDDIRFRTHALSLRADVWGEPLLGPDEVLMELKTNGGLPLWMTGFLTEHHITKTTFSKYGSAYSLLRGDRDHGGKRYA